MATIEMVALKTTKSKEIWKKSILHMLYILTSIWVRFTPNAGQNLSSSIDISYCAYLGGHICPWETENRFGYNFNSIGVFLCVVAVGSL